MFYYTENVSGFITIHVDDILWSGSNNVEHKIMAKLQNCFIIGKENSVPVWYLGLHLSENSMKNSVLDQNNYIAQLVKVSNIDNSTSVLDKMRSTTLDIYPNQTRYNFWCLPTYKLNEIRNWKWFKIRIESYKACSKRWSLH